MPGKPPYFPMYARDFVADGKVVAMTAEQTGAYAMLLCYAWLEEPAGSIPNDDRILSRWAKMPMSRWIKIRGDVLAPFEERNGRYFQKRMVAEFSLMMEKRAGYAERGRKGGISQAKLKLSLSKAQAPAHDTDTEDGICISFGLGERGKGKPEEPLGFAEFWRQYPRRQAKPRALKAWLSLCPDDETQAAIMAGIARMPPYPPHELQFCPHPASWLNARRWEDETHPQTGKVEPDALAGIRAFVANGETK